MSQRALFALPHTGISCKARFLPTPAFFVDVDVYTNDGFKTRQQENGR